MKGFSSLSKNVNILYFCTSLHQSKFKKSAATFAKKRRQKAALRPEEIDTAHSAVLGLCAFVDTHPYHVPKYLPDVLVILTTHLNDPQPIPVSGKNTFLVSYPVHPCPSD